MDNKTDMGRIGLFSEKGYVTVGDKFPRVHRDFMAINDKAHKGKQMHCGFPQKKANGLNWGYFDPKFMRLFEKEAYSDALKRRRQFHLKENKKNLTKCFMPPSHEKEPNGTAMFYGTFTKGMPYLSPQLKKVPKKRPPGKNLYTEPGKKGTYGYPGTTIGEYPEYKDDKFDRSKMEYAAVRKRMKEGNRGPPMKLNNYPQEYFWENPYRSDKPVKPPKPQPPRPKEPLFKPSNPAKKDGGMKAGTFDPFPSYGHDPYKKKGKAYKTPKRDGNVFLPSEGIKPYPVKSIVNYNVTKATNVTNVKNTRKVMAY